MHCPLQPSDGLARPKPIAPPTTRRAMKRGLMRRGALRRAPTIRRRAVAPHTRRWCSFLPRCPSLALPPRRAPRGESRPRFSDRHAETKRHTGAARAQRHSSAETPGEETGREITACTPMGPFSSSWCCQRPPGGSSHCMPSNTFVTHHSKRRAQRQQTYLGGTAAAEQGAARLRLQNKHNAHSPTQTL